MKVARTLLPVFCVAALSLPAPASGPEPAEWNQWRGPNRDGLSPDTGLLKQWPPAGPPLAWKAAGLGGGFSSVSFAGARIFTMGDVGDSCAVVALNLADGKVAWTAKVGRTGGGGGYPGPRCTPATDGTLVYALGQYGDLVCVEAATGKERWRKNLSTEFGGRMMSGWGYSESPLLDGDQVVVTPGGQRGAVLALNKSDGQTLWQSADFKDAAAYASLVPVEIGGTRQYLVLTGASVAGIEAKSGKLLWRADRPGRTAVIPTPVYRDGLVFVTSGYGVGCNVFKVTRSNGEFQAQEVYKGMQMANHHGGVTLVGDHVYGIDERSLKCIELSTGRVVWENRSVGKGAVAFADGHFVCRSERGAGTIALVEATAEGYKEKGRFDQPDRSRQSSWPHPVIFGKKLYIRDQDLLLCYDVAAK